MDPLPYIYNYLCHLPLMSRVLFFADDTTGYLGGKHLNYILTQISKDMQIIKEWLGNNRLILNVSKTHAMHLSYKKQSNTLENFSIFGDGNEKIDFLTEIKILGVIIDNKLLFSSHILSLSKKVNSKYFLLSKSLYLFSSSFRPILFTNYSYNLTLITVLHSSCIINKKDINFNDIQNLALSCCLK